MAPHGGLPDTIAKPGLWPCTRCQIAKGTGMTVQVTEGDARDVAAIMPIMETAFDPHFSEAWTAAQCLSALAIPGSRLLLAKRRSDIAGFALSRWVLESEELLMIGVSLDHQRQGVGSGLLNEMIRLARQENREQLFLEVRDGNAAHAFYSAIGFRPIGHRKQYYKGTDGQFSDAITMGFAL
jgi:[ribosomal protein S18]-alanine N-acetyltransferase